MSGSLVLVATPIGNLGDITRRAIELLEEADVIFCEDTRRSRTLLSALGIPAAGRLRALHEHNERALASAVAERVAQGELVALVSDAGMPGISDPGTAVVSELAARGLPVTVAPGASSVLAALVLSGLPTERFCVEGFLPRKGKERRARLAALSDEERTSVILESPRRLAATLAELARVIGGGRPVVVARELTKLHEELWRGSVTEAAAAFAERELRGEIVVVLGGRETEDAEVADDEIRAHLAISMAAGGTRRDAAHAAAAELGVARRRAYELALEQRS